MSDVQKNEELELAGGQETTDGSRHKEHNDPRQTPSRSLCTMTTLQKIKVGLFNYHIFLSYLLNRKSKMRWLVAYNTYHMF